MKISFITTVFNEEKTIESFLKSITSQTKLPDEIVISDGMSTDNTVDRIEKYESRIKKKKVKITVLVKKGNRSVGRNEAIKYATGDIIVCSDAGNVLDKDWVKNIIKPFKDLRVNVVAGYYQGKAKNIFQKCLIPFALVMPDKVDPQTFLPATRSVAFTKKIWKKVGGFDERFSHNEDYVFANKLKEKGAKIVFARDAIVNWIPRSTYKQAFVMFFRFALGDAEAGIWRTSVLLLFARYFIGIYFLFLSLLYKSFIPLVIILIAIFCYIAWSIKKNYPYVNDIRAFRILPLLQLTADAAVLSGTTAGVIKRLGQFHYWQYIKQNKFLFFVLVVYGGVLLLTLDYGIPNRNHPFPYMMDEWHQLESVANTYRYGTPNVFGSANGTMFHFLLSGLYLIPFMLFKIIDPFALQIDNWEMRQKVFEIFRLETIIFGILSIFMLYSIAKLINVPKKLAIFLFTCTPIWLYLSSYFKYDIALMFWILLSLWSCLYFGKYPTGRNFILAAIPSALAFAVKVSSIPLLPIYLGSYVIFRQRKMWNYRHIVAGFGVFLGIVIFFGMPDTIFGKGNILRYLYENIIQSPASTSNFQLGMNSYEFLLLHNYPTIFGVGLLSLFIVALLVHIYTFLRNFKNIDKYKNELFIWFVLLVFVISLIPLKLFAAGNRSLVLLPFFVLLIGMTWAKMIQVRKLKLVTTGVLIIVSIIQIYVSFSWIHIKLSKSPQEISSEWMIQNIPAKQQIGLENIPIYQGIPELLQREFYFSQYNINYTSRYTYQVVDATSKSLPPVVVIANGQIDSLIYRQSSKRDLIQRLERESYKKIAEFSPDFFYYQLFGTGRDYYLSYIAGTPLSISIYKK